MKHRHVLITGASRGLGAALAKRLAGDGVHFELCARDISNVVDLSNTLISKCSTVNWTSVDVAQTSSVTNWIEAASKTTEIDLLILNAGVFDGRDQDQQLETPTRAAALIQTNLTGSVVAALTAAKNMRARNKGHIVFISSLASFADHADAPTYSASKAGIASFARALREDLAPTDVRVSIVHPGHIKTHQTQNHIGAMPGLISAQEAANTIVKGIERGKSEISFPITLRLALAFLGMLPWRLRAKINKPFRFHVRSSQPSDPN